MVKEQVLHGGRRQQRPCKCLDYHKHIYSLHLGVSECTKKTAKKKKASKLFSKLWHSFRICYFFKFCHFKRGGVASLLSLWRLKTCLSRAALQMGGLDAEYGSFTACVCGTRSSHREESFCISAIQMWSGGSVMWYFRKKTPHDLCLFITVDLKLEDD